MHTESAASAAPPVKSTDLILSADHLRSIDLSELQLAKGSHRDPECGMCVMEAVAFFAGEEHTDHPACACPVITSVMISFNDDWSDEARQGLKRYIPRLVGTRSTPAVELRRSFLVLDHVVRSLFPEGLDLVGLTENASALRALPELQDEATAKAAATILAAAAAKIGALDLALARALALALARALDLARARALALDLDRARALALDLDRARALALALALSKSSSDVDAERAREALRAAEQKITEGSYGLIERLLAVQA